MVDSVGKVAWDLLRLARFGRTSLVSGREIASLVPEAGLHEMELWSL